MIVHVLWLITSISLLNVSSSDVTKLTTTNMHNFPDDCIDGIVACDLCWDKSEQYDYYDFDEIRMSHGCIQCLDSSTYSLAILSVFIYFIFLAAMVILFHAAMTFRIFSIFTWIQIAAIVFYRASNVFSPIYQRWGLLSTISFFSPSIWNSKCLATDPFDQGVSFGIVSITVISIYFIFLGATYFHHFIRHHPNYYYYYNIDNNDNNKNNNNNNNNNNNTNNNDNNNNNKNIITNGTSQNNDNHYQVIEQQQQHQTPQDLDCKQKCIRLFLNCLESFEKRWQLPNHNNEQEEDEENEDGQQIALEMVIPNTNIIPTINNKLSPPNSFKHSPNINISSNNTLHPLSISTQNSNNQSSNNSPNHNNNNNNNNNDNRKSNGNNNNNNNNNNGNNIQRVNIVVNNPNVIRPRNLSIIPDQQDLNDGVINGNNRKVHHPSLVVYIFFLFLFLFFT